MPRRNTAFTPSSPIPGILLIFLLTLECWAQQIPDFSVLYPLEESPAAFTLQASAQEVDLVLSVTDHRGRFVNKLKASDLTVLDNDEKQTALTFFQSETDLPLRIALLLDVSGSVAYRFDAEQSAIHSFLKTVMRPRDSAALFAFSKSLQLVSPSVENWKQVRAQMKKIKPDGDTAIYDAIVSASQWVREDKRPARRLIILITDGGENASHATIEQAISAALKSEASIYSVNVEQFFFDSDEKKGKQILEQVAEQTGGVYLQPDQDGDTSDAFAKIRRELRNQYALAYRPTNLAQRTFHRLVVLAPSGLRVRCRRGYYLR